jgi:hypothetical protein
MQQRLPHLERVMRRRSASGEEDGGQDEFH